MAKRFIVNLDDIKNVYDDEHFEIFGDEVKHIQVLRFNVGDEIKINEYVCVIEEMKRSSVVVRKIKALEKKGEPKLELTLYVALLKNEKLDYVVQKAVELGVKRVAPFVSQNVIVKLDTKAKEKRVLKLQKIANEACKQCGRTDLVEVENIISFKDMLEKLNDFSLNIFAYEKETKKLKESLEEARSANVEKISCIIGPEGGFSQKEADEISSIESSVAVSLGERILRADTAAVNLISIIMYEFDS